MVSAMIVRCAQYRNFYRSPKAILIASSLCQTYDYIIAAFYTRDTPEELYTGNARAGNLPGTIAIK